MPAKQPAAVKKPLSAEIEGILSSDEAWLSFAVIKTPAGQKSYREGEMLAGFDNAYIQKFILIMWWLIMKARRRYFT
jgi:general secretion pathway protein C